MPQGSGEGKEWEIFMELEDGTRLNEHKVEHSEALDGKPPVTSTLVESERSKRYRIAIKDRCPSKREGKKEVMATLIHDSMPKAQDDYLAFHNNTGDFVVYDAQVQQVNGKVVNCRLTFPAHSALGISERSDKKAIGSLTIELREGESTCTCHAANVICPDPINSRGRKNNKKIAIKGNPPPPGYECESNFETETETPFYVFRFQYGSKAALERHLARQAEVPEPEVVNIGIAPPENIAATEDPNGDIIRPNDPEIDDNVEIDEQPEVHPDIDVKPDIKPDVRLLPIISFIPQAQPPVPATPQSLPASPSTVARVLGKRPRSASPAKSEASSSDGSGDDETMISILTTVTEKARKTVRTATKLLRKYEAKTYENREQQRTGDELTVLHRKIVTEKEALLAAAEADLKEATDRQEVKRQRLVAS